MKTICIMCPMGCPLEIEKRGDEITVTGNTCKRGELYGVQEMTKPTRVVTSLVRLSTGGVVSVKTDKPVDKHLITAVLQDIGKLVLTPPLCIGDVAAVDISNSGANLVITSNVK